MRGAEAFTALFTGIWQAFPDLTFTTLAGPFMAENAPSCMVHLRLTSTLSAPLNDWKKVGGSVDLDMMALYEFRDGRLSRVRVCGDPGVIDAQLALA